ncbi:MAG: ATP-binding protein [Rhodocyclaceae bacterium]|nr:ATP-binding protein [Rhodocyclaceae bacterium]
MKSLGIRGRILLAAFAPAALVALLVSGVLVVRQVDQTRVDQHRRLYAVARQLASAAEFGIFSGNTDGLQKLLESALTEPDVVAAAFLDPDGKVLASTLPISELPPPEEVYAGFAPPLDHKLDEHWHAQPIQPTDHGEADFFADPARLASPLLGQLLIKVSMASLRGELRNHALNAATISSLILFFSVLLALVLSRSLIRTLTDIGQVVEGIGQGQHGLRVASAGSDELSQLAAGINQMAEATGQTHEQLATRIAAATAELRRERDAAELAAQARSRFFAAASHDLRQPAQALGLFVARLERDARRSKLHPQLHKLAQGVHNLQGLLDTLLDYSRLDGQALRFAPRPLQARQTLSQVVESFAEAAAAKHLGLRTRIADCWLMTDPVLLHRVLINLIGNAVRHTHSGGILVACRRGERHARIEVWDTGPGIPPEFQESIFEELVQLDNPERDAEKGLGLGLAIARRSAGLLNHPLSLCSRVGHGSRFALSIPLAPPAAAEAGAGEAAPEHMPILLVGAPTNVQDELATQLEDWHFAVEHVADAAAAQDWLARHGAPRILLLEVPDGATGIEKWQVWLDRIEANTGRALPALFVCNGPVPALVAQPGNAAPRLLLARPFRPARLRALLNRLIEPAETAD